MTYAEILRTLTEAGIDDAGYEASLLISCFCGVPPARLPLERERDFRSVALYDAVERRAARYPLQYILGEWEFCTERYEVAPDCLIPRPETELLVLRAAKALPRGAVFLDLCTGSGCIAISVLARRRDCSAVAVDLFDRTLERARRNAEKNGVADRVELLKCDLLSADAAEAVCRGSTFAAILSNPPYIKSRDMKRLAPELAFEPWEALDGGEDGLNFYRAIIPSFVGRLLPNGFMLFEAGVDTVHGVADIGREYFDSVEIIKDHSGRDRMVRLWNRKLTGN